MSQLHHKTCFYAEVVENGDVHFALVVFVCDISENSLSGMWPDVFVDNSSVSVFLCDLWLFSLSFS